MRNDDKLKIKKQIQKFVIARKERYCDKINKKAFIIFSLFMQKFKKKDFKWNKIIKMWYKLNNEKIDTIMNLEFEKIIISEKIYLSLVQLFCERIRTQKDPSLNTIVLFCKYIFAKHLDSLKMFLCLRLICDVSHSFPAPLLEKTLDEHIPDKLLEAIKISLTKQKEEFNENTEKFIELGIETILFWSKKISLSFKELKESKFSLALSAISLFLNSENMHLLTHSKFSYYNRNDITVNLFSESFEKETKIEKKEPEVNNNLENKNNEVESEEKKLLKEIEERFANCKNKIESLISEIMFEEQCTRPLLIILRDFLLFILLNINKLKICEKSSDQDVSQNRSVIYFHMIYNLYSKLQHFEFVMAEDLIKMTKECFEENYNSEVSSVERNLILELVNIKKIDTFSLFRKIEEEIKVEEKKLPPCELILFHGDHRLRNDENHMEHNENRERQ